MYELTTMALLAVTGGFIGFGWALPAYLLFFSSLWLVTLIDFRHYLIPNRILYPTLFGCIGMLTLAALLGDDFDRLFTALLGMAVGWLFFFIVWFVYPPGLGFGDVRLSALIGLLAGWLSLLHVGLAVILGLLFGAVCGLVLMAVRIRGRKEAIPFGPFLAAGAVVSIVAGAPIINWWLGA